MFDSGGTQCGDHHGLTGLAGIADEAIACRDPDFRLVGGGESRGVEAVDPCAEFFGISGEHRAAEEFGELVALGLGEDGEFAGVTGNEAEAERHLEVELGGVGTGD